MHAAGSRPDCASGSDVASAAVPASARPFISSASASASRARLAVLFLLVAVAGCGGGGGSAPLPPPPPPALIPAVLSVPEPVGYSDAKLAAFHRLNELRAQAGLGLLAQNPALDAAAQAHVEWEVANDLYTHIETAGTPMFVGAYPQDRDAKFGYAMGGFNYEVLAASYAPAAAVDALVQTIYHRQAVLAPQLLDTGIGWSDQPIAAFGTPIAIDSATPGDNFSLVHGQAMRIEAGGVSVWPTPNANQVLCVMGGEYPNPLPGRDMWSIGTPVSIEAAFWQTLSVSSFLLRDESGTAVDASLLTWSNDPNVRLHPNFVAIIPTAPLLHNTKYYAEFHGSIDGKPLTKSWAFTTGDVDAPPSGY